MSFILEALKKSENARQRQIGPAMAEIPRRRRQSERPIWAFVVAGLLLVNIGVLGLVLSRKKGGDVQPVSAAAAAPLGNTAMQQQLPSPPAVPARQPVLLEPEPAPMQQAPNRNYGGASSLAAESGSPSELAGDTVEPADAGMQAQVQAALAQEAPRPIQAPAVAPLANNPQLGRNAPAAPVANAPQGRNAEVLPTIDELQASGRTFPPLRLDIHSFTDKPAERFVFVNMRRYNEGMTLQEGPSVERITEEGVVLNQQGLRFLLPRP
jgi:general secretion pathway protein B